MNTFRVFKNVYFFPYCFAKNTYLFASKFICTCRIPYGEIIRCVSFVYFWHLKQCNDNRSYILRKITNSKLTIYIQCKNCSQFFFKRRFLQMCIIMLMHEPSNKLLQYVYFTRLRLTVFTFEVLVCSEYIQKKKHFTKFKNPYKIQCSEFVKTFHESLYNILWCTLLMYLAKSTECIQ